MLPTGCGNGVRVQLLSWARRIPTLASLCMQTREMIKRRSRSGDRIYRHSGTRSESLRVKQMYACIAQEDKLASSSRVTWGLNTVLLVYSVLQYSREGTVLGKVNHVIQKEPEAYGIWGNQGEQVMQQIRDQSNR
jgi:ArsR family metal-binding transcriptional regulator